MKLSLIRIKHLTLVMLKRQIEVKKAIDRMKLTIIYQSILANKDPIVIFDKNIEEIVKKGFLLSSTSI